jgi:hypothetical protein
LPTDSASRDQRFIEMQRGQSRLKALRDGAADFKQFRFGARLAFQQFKQRRVFVGLYFHGFIGIPFSNKMRVGTIRGLFVAARVFCQEQQR